MEAILRHVVYMRCGKFDAFSRTEVVRQLILFKDYTLFLSRLKRVFQQKKLYFVCLSLRAKYLIFLSWR